MEKIELVRSIFFILAGFYEIGGGYLVWLWLREGKSVWIVGSNCAGYLWSYTNLSARKCWPDLRCLWWRIYRSLHSLGMEGP